jgi:death-on-curing protein
VSRWTWVSHQAAIDLHAEQLEEHGGAAGLRDENALLSALARPQQIANYEPDADVFRLAAAYAYGLVQNHAFVDGNKRIALVVSGAFLALNGWHLDAPEREAERMMFALAAKTIDERMFAEWLKNQSVTL